MGLILDSSVVVAQERLGRSAYQMIDAIRLANNDPELALSVVTVLELAHGVARADTHQRRRNRQKFLDDLLAAIPIYPVTTPMAFRAGLIDGRSRADGKTIPLADLLIAVTALELGYSVATANVRHFEMIPGVVLTSL